MCLLRDIRSALLCSLQRWLQSTGACMPWAVVRAMRAPCPHAWALPPHAVHEAPPRGAMRCRLALLGAPLPASPSRESIIAFLASCQVGWQPGDAPRAPCQLTPPGGYCNQREWCRVGCPSAALLWPAFNYTMLPAPPHPPHTPHTPNPVSPWCRAAPRGRLWGRAVPAGAPGPHLCRRCCAGHIGRGGRALWWAPSAPGRDRGAPPLAAHTSAFSGQRLS